MHTAGVEPRFVSNAGGVASQSIDRTIATILVVEDEDFVREVTSEVLIAADYRVLRARTAAEAIRLFRETGDPAQLLLTDVVLPGRSGYLLANDLRALSPMLKVIFISGYPENAVSKSDLSLPDSCYLPKPFSVETLLEKVQAVFAEAAMVTQESIQPKSAVCNRDNRLRINETVIDYVR